MERLSLLAFFVASLATSSPPFGGSTTTALPPVKARFVLRDFAPFVDSPGSASRATVCNLILRMIIPPRIGHFVTLLAVYSSPQIGSFALINDSSRLIADPALGTWFLRYFITRTNLGIPARFEGTANWTPSFCIRYLYRLLSPEFCLDPV